MEDTLEESLQRHEHSKVAVLILVFMEDTLEGRSLHLYIQ